MYGAVLSLAAGTFGIMSCKTTPPHVPSRPEPRVEATATPPPTLTEIPLIRQRVETTPIAVPVMPPTPYVPKPVLIYGNSWTSGKPSSILSKITSYAFVEGINLSIAGNVSELKEELKKDFGGIYVMSNELNPNPVDFFMISSFVRKGGRAVLELGSSICKKGEITQALRNYFGISMACNDKPITDAFVLNTEEHVPPLKDGKYSIGMPEAPKAYLVTKEDYVTGKVKKGGIEYTVTAYGKLGAGEVFIIVFPDLVIPIYDADSLITDDGIEYYDNKEVGLGLLKWLSRR